MPKFKFKNGSVIHLKKVTVIFRERGKDVTPYMDIFHYDGTKERISSLEPIFAQLHAQLLNPEFQCSD